MIQTPRNEPPATPNDDTVKTITPSKTLYSSESHNPGNYFDAELGTLTLNPIGHTQSTSANISPENLQTWNELPFSPLKTDGSLAIQEDLKLPSVPDILADVTPQTISRRPESTPSKGTLPGVESFDHGVASMKLLSLAAKLQNSMSDLSYEERRICLEIASDWQAKKTHDTLKPEEAAFKNISVKRTEEVYEMAREGPKQEGFGCPVCPKSFNRQSALK